MTTRIYELQPKDGHKSFYGKAKVCVESNGDAVLISYTTPVLKITANGEKIRLWSGWSSTTGRHIAAFAGINKAEWEKMKVQHA